MTHATSIQSVVPYIDAEVGPMEVDFALPGIGAQAISLWDANTLRRLSPTDTDNLRKLLDLFGKRSATAQGLNAPITDIHRLRSTDQRLYLLAARHGGHTKVLGGLKIGSKKLFMRSEDGALREVEPVCVLDFYVHEGCQRQGIGTQLFQNFLEREQLQAAEIAYDRPSQKLLAFLSRHYSLRSYVPQNNNFVLFSEFWLHQPRPTSRQAHGRRAQARPTAVSTPAGTPLHHTQPLPLPSHEPDALQSPEWLANLVGAPNAMSDGGAGGGASGDSPAYPPADTATHMRGPASELEPPQGWQGHSQGHSEPASSRPTVHGLVVGMAGEDGCPGEYTSPAQLNMDWQAGMGPGVMGPGSRGHGSMGQVGMGQVGMGQRGTGQGTMGQGVRGHGGMGQGGMGEEGRGQGSGTQWHGETAPPRPHADSIDWFRSESIGRAGPGSGNLPTDHAQPPPGSMGPSYSSMGPPQGQAWGSPGMPYSQPISVGMTFTAAGSAHLYQASPAPFSSAPGGGPYGGAHSGSAHLYQASPATFSVFTSGGRPNGGAHSGSAHLYQASPAPFSSAPRGGPYRGSNGMPYEMPAGRPSAQVNRGNVTPRNLVPPWGVDLSGPHSIKPLSYSPAGMRTPQYDSQSQQQGPSPHAASAPGGTPSMPSPSWHQQEQQQQHVDNQQISSTGFKGQGHSGGFNNDQVYSAGKPVPGANGAMEHGFARTAGLAARAGKGAAGCLAW